MKIQLVTNDCVGDRLYPGGSKDLRQKKKMDYEVTFIIHLFKIYILKLV